MIELSDYTDNSLHRRGRKSKKPLEIQKIEAIRHAFNQGGRDLVERWCKEHNIVDPEKRNLISNARLGKRWKSEYEAWQRNRPIVKALILKKRKRR